MLPFKDTETLARSLYETSQTARQAFALPTVECPWNELGDDEQSVYLCMAGAATRQLGARFATRENRSSHFQGRALYAPIQSAVQSVTTGRDHRTRHTHQHSGEKAKEAITALQVALAENERLKVKRRS